MMEAIKASGGRSLGFACQCAAEKVIVHGHPGYQGLSMPAIAASVGFGKYLQACLILQGG